MVEHHLSALQDVLREVAPEARIEVRSVDGGIILDGAVRDPVKAQELREIAGRYLGENETLINRVSVAAPTQVNLRVRVAEVSREVTKLFGINWEAIFTPATSCSAWPPAARSPPAAAFRSCALERPGGAAMNSFFGSYSNGDVSVNGIIDALEREGLVNVLAEPNLTALSGETASFLAGGEFPVPIGQDDDDSITIEFKQFGVEPRLHAHGAQRQPDQHARPAGGQRPERQGRDQARRPGHPGPVARGVPRPRSSSAAARASPSAG